ncbi:MAG: MBL fold metallo-hydrolase [Bacteroides sp.]|nr:MBL fold metallo-hydrolase [Bacteroides sp.]
MIDIFSVIFVLFLAVVGFVNTPTFGRRPQGARKERIVNSPNYQEGSFRNLQETPQITSDKGVVSAMVSFLFTKKDRLRPQDVLPHEKTDLHALDPQEEVVVWFGHSSYYIQTGGKRILVDPVFSDAGSPLPFYNRSFKGMNLYQAMDVPDPDYVFVSHDHWDHMDYPTLKALRQRTGKVICGLGVGAHLERWKFAPEQIVEMDWNENIRLDDSFLVHCLPARHFSGRGFFPNQTLWASFLIQTPEKKIYLGGDSGYGEHYREIGNQFGPIDLAILENGQYDADWKYIHMMPEEVVRAAQDLQSDRLLTVHHSRFALSKHPWDEPLIRVTDAANIAGIDLLTPIVGQKVDLNDSTYVTVRWWEEVH